MLDFIQQASLNTQDFDKKIEFLYNGILAKNMITLCYADGGNGKSWLAFALAKHCVKNGLTTIYCDFDNPLTVLKDRNIDELLIKPHNNNLSYVQRGKSNHTPSELLELLNEQATGKKYSDHVIFIDSLRNFCNVNNDLQAMQTMNILMNIREAGATIVILHHSNKDGKNYQGSNNIRNSVDNMYQVIKLDSKEQEIKLHLKVKKERCSITDCAINIKANDLSIKMLDTELATMKTEEETFVNTVKQALTDNKTQNKGQLLKTAGKEKTDKTARNWLDKYENKYWTSKKESGVFNYTLLKTGATK